MVIQVYFSLTESLPALACAGTFSDAIIYLLGSVLASYHLFSKDAMKKVAASMSCCGFC